MKPLPTLRQLRYLSALAEHRHFGRAAETCLVTQSTLSAGLQELEQILGATLVERTKRWVMLTPLGVEVERRGARLLREAEDMVEMVEAASEPLSGTLRLGVIPTIAPYLLPRLLPPLRLVHPRLKLYLREDLSARLLDGLNSGQIDAALLALPYDADGVEIAEIGDDPFLLACPPGHPLCGKKALCPDDLASAELLLLEEGHCLREHALAACHLPTSRSGESVRGTSLHTIVQMAASGLGVTLLPKLAVDAGAAEGTGLVIRALGEGAPARRLALMWRKSSPRGVEFRQLAAFISDLLSGALPETLSEALPAVSGSVSS
ncbi:MAG TPA: hydrogen peroxide-inducible genes activator [Candidatus Sulfotelmatobacter sp.]|jgi:LysR family hydrogen peroxide-inducible transcriptional activator|nr:hydrogen peroxide-inducible genes activator [Candidatus Sulfotelmatobacter sp.]